MSDHQRDAQPSAKQPDNANHVRFPPFPVLTPGVNIISFKEFRECGIKVIAGDGGIEIDGRNVPTVELLKKHEDDICKSNAKRKRKKIKPIDVPGASIVGATGQRKEWWQLWEEGEDQRLYRYDASMSRIDQLLAAATDFRSRPWPASAVGLHTLWDQFRLFVGLLTNTPVFRKADGGKSALDDDSDEDSDGEAVPIPTGHEVNGQSMVATENDKDVKGTFAEIDDVREDKLNGFLNDPEKTVKIFLSSYMRRQGLIWADRNLNLMPRLVSFFLRFLLRNRVFSDATAERGLRSALEVANLGMTELPLTSKMAKSMPDTFSEGCKECWGSKSDSYKYIPPPDTQDKAADETERDAKRQRLDGADAEQKGENDSGATAGEKAEANAFEEELRAANITIVPTSEGLDLAKEIITDNMDADCGGWGQAPAADSEWGDWAAEADWTSNPGTKTDKSWLTAWQVPVRSLLHLLGPTALPNTHTTGIVEFSVRRILSMTMPPVSGAVSGAGIEAAGAIESELKARFARVVLAPWIGWESKDEPGYSQPRILQASRGAVVGHECQGEISRRKPHDPRKDEITVLYNPSVVPTMNVGMGIGAIWVQVVRQEKEGDSSADATAKNGKGKKKKGPETYWYMEELSMTLPSYYMPL